MELDVLENSAAYPCKPASDKVMMRTIEECLAGRTDAFRILRQRTFRIPVAQILWSSVKVLGILGSVNRGFNTILDEEGFPSGTYLNHDGTWLILIHPEETDIQSALDHCAKRLKYLLLFRTSLRRLDVVGAAALEKFHARENPELSEIHGLVQLEHLTELSLSRCDGLAQLPPLDQLNQLTTLDLFGWVSLTRLPPLDQLEQLKVLNLSACFNLTQLPPLDHLKQLKILNLSGCCNLTQLPPLDHLEQLTKLNLSGCKSLTDLPPLDHLEQLTTLNLSECERLIELPSLDHQEQLTTLDISKCRSFTKLPHLDHLEKLTTLNLSGCGRLTELPPLDHLEQLTTLNLSGCRSLTQLPSLDHMEQLTVLNLSGCRSLVRLPPLDHLKRLTTLVLSRCTILAQLPPLDHLERLRSLDLSRCTNLTQLPPLDHLQQLITLDLFGCGIHELPEGIRGMTSLRSLDLSYLKLRTLPDWLLEIAGGFSVGPFGGESEKNKAFVYMSGTTVDDIPDMSIFDQPYEMVVKFFEERKHPLNEIKVVFLGDGEAGKSHTIARLMSGGGEPLDYTDKSTPGIVIRHKEYDLDGRKIQVNYWDFGGQEIMHSMHRIFLTNRTMYVILLNARDDTQNERAKYWLHNVRSFAPDAPVLLVLNKIDQNENASVDEVGLRGQYERLTRVVRMSALNFTREQFNSAFTDVLLDEIGKTGFLDAQWPITWTNVKKQLEHMESYHITGTDYQKICADCKVDRNQKELLHWFNDLGVSFCYDGEEDFALEDYVILRPDWITNALYIILFNKLQGAENGRIPHRSIYRLLKNAADDPQIRCTLPEARYNQGDIQYVLGIMRKFSLSLAVGDDEEFIPMLCQQNSMVNVQNYHKDEDTLEFNMEFDYLPNNLLHRLMVERHGELDMANVWRTGARFEMKDLGLSAVVVIDDRTLRIFIHHRDGMHRPNTYLAMLKSNVDQIVGKMSLKAPTNYLIYKLDGKQDVYDYEMLKAMQAAGQTQVFSMTWRRMISIEDVLNQSAPAHLEDEMKLLDEIRRSCRKIQDEHHYRLGEEKQGRDMEDFRNRRIRDDLRLLGFSVADQSQHGVGGTGRNAGEPDMVMLDNRGELWTIIEALRVSDENKKAWNAHLDKLLNRYNSSGLRQVYLLTYVDADPADFGKIWESYQQHIRGYDPKPYGYCEGSFRDLTEANSALFVRTVRCRYAASGEPVTVYHIFVFIPTRNG